MFQQFYIMKKTSQLKKFPIQETLILLACADSSTDAKWLQTAKNR